MFTRDLRRSALIHGASIALSMLLIPLAQAVDSRAAGLWKTIDDETGQAKSLIRIEVNNDALTGRVEKILPPGDPKAVCKACEGSRKDQPVQGMLIIQDMRRGPDGFKDGTILDPKKGKEYRCLLWVDEDDNNKLNVRGYIGVPMFGRSQTWLRVH